MSGIHARSALGKLENDDKDLRFKHFVTGQKIGPSRRALDTIAMGVYEVATDTVEAGSDNNLVVLTAHSARPGDFLRIDSSSNGIQELEASVDEVSANSLRLGTVLSANLEAGDTVTILRPITPRMSSSGATLATLDPAAIMFRQDGTLVEVTEDTATPSNNKALPVRLMGVNGTLNLTANDLDISSSHTEDSIRLGDGTTLTNVTLNNELKVKDTDVETQLTTLNAKDFATQTTLDALLTAFNAEDFATQTTLEAARALLASLDGKDFATQTTLAAILADLQLKADLSETQPVSVASLPLPTGAATEVTLEAARALLASLDGKDFATQTTLAAQKAVIDLLNTAQGAQADAAVTNPASSASVIAALKGILTLLTTVNTKLDTLDVNTSAELDSTNTSVATSGTFTPPAAARGMIVQNGLNATAAIRFTGSAGTPNDTTGFFLDAGQSTSYMPAGEINFARVGASGDVDVSVIWFV